MFERAMRWITLKLSDSVIPPTIEQRWLWLPTNSTFDSVWEDALLPGGNIKGDSLILQSIAEPVPYAYLVPLLSDHYCDWLIELADSANKWRVDSTDEFAAWEVNLNKVRSSVYSYHKQVVIMDVLQPLFAGLYQWKCERVARAFLVKYKAGSTITAMDSHWDGRSLVSVSINLTDPSEYEGGHLTFLRTPDEEIVAPKGHALMFSGNPAMSHQVHPVTKGTRYVLVYWLK